MLLEEALVGNGNNANPSTPAAAAAAAANSSANLSPHDEALAILSFVRDELPAGGTAAEKRFVNLVPLIVNRVFGEWNIAPAAAPDGSPRSSPRPGQSPRSPSVTSPGGSTYSSPNSSPAQERDYRHVEGGWLSLVSSPAVSQRGGGNNNNNGGGNRTSQSSRTSTSLENDPIARLLRAPRKQRASNNNDGDNFYYAPTLLDALSAESIHRPSVRFKFPLEGLALAAHPLVEDWKVCFWNEFEREAAEHNVNNATSNAAGRGGFGSTMPGAASAAGGVNAENKHVEKPPGIIGKENATQILLRLLSGSSKDQYELVAHFQQLYNQQQHQAQQHSQHGFGSPTSSRSFNSNFTSPLKQRGMMNSSRYQSTPNSNRVNAIHEPNLDLTMLEYYLFLFVRYPLANTSWQLQLEDQQRRQRQYRKKFLAPYGQRVHSYLFSSYLNHYLGQGRAYDVNRLGVGIDCFGGGNSPAAIDTPSFSSNYSAVAMMDRTSELFLRLLIEFWVEGPNIAPTTNAAIARYRRVRTGVSSAQTIANPSLSDSLELAQPFSMFASPPSQVQIYVLNLARHLVSDKSMWELVQNASGMCQRRQREERAGASAPSLVNENSAGNVSSESNDNLNQVAWCLPPAMTASQPSILNYIRLGLACGAIHDRSSIFHRALETWLVWLEPWNYVMKKRVLAVNRSGSNVGNANVGGRGRAAGEFLRNAAATVSSHNRVEYYPSYVQPKPTSPSKYSSQWEAYVVSNAHFYTVPLAIFLKRARELDFSSTVEYPRSLALVQRVLRIYSKVVVNALNGVLSKRADGLSMSLVGRHRTNMRAFCPPSAWKFVECQLDAINLLEEVFVQYQKRRAMMDFFDRMEARFNALFDGKIGSEEASLESLLSQVRYLVNLPMHYQVLPEEQPRASHGFFQLGRLLGLGSQDDPNATNNAISENHFLGPERGADGRLTDLGRQQIHAGLSKCNPMDVHYIGDPMLARVKSYEIPLLVELTIGASNYLNKKLGLVVPTEEDNKGHNDDDDSMLMKRFHEMERYRKIRFRFNLRFLADSRNIIFLAIVWWLVTTLSGFFRK